MHLLPRSPALDTPDEAAWIFWLSKNKGGYDENWSSLIGIVTAIVGNVLISFALNMQRYAHIRLDREWQEKERQRKRRSAWGVETTGVKIGTAASENDPLIAARPGLSSGDSPSSEGDEGKEERYKQKSYLKSPYWWAGIILMTVGEAGNFLAYGFAPASIVSPLGVVALISNCIIAPFLLKEPFRKRDALGVVIAVGGAVTVVLSASDNNPKLGPGEIWNLISTWEFETYLGVTVGLMVVLMVASNRYGDKNILIDLGLVGLFGGYTALSTKGIASLLSYTLWRVITFPVFYLLLTILVGTAIMQIKYVNRALQRFDATQVIPVQFVLFTLSVILGSAVLYRDFERTSGDDAGKFVGGCAMTFLGVSFITTGRPRRHDDDNDDEEARDPESENAIHLAEEPYHDDFTDTETDTNTPKRRLSIRPSSPPLIPTTSPYHSTLSRPSTPNPNPPLDRHTSTPLLPSQLPPLPPQPHPSTSTTSIPTTPQLRRLKTNDRHSPSPLPLGPVLASPLSSTLSTMVKDLKRSGGGGGLGRERGRAGDDVFFDGVRDVREGEGEGEERSCSFQVNHDENI